MARPITHGVNWARWQGELERALRAHVERVIREWHERRGVKSP